MIASLACTGSTEREKTKPEKADPAVEATSDPAPSEPTEAVIPDDVARLLESRRATLRLPAKFEVEMNGEGRRVDFWARPVGETGYALGYDLGSEPADTSEVHPLAARAMHVFLHNYAPVARISEREVDGRARAVQPEPVGPPTTLAPEVAARYGADLVIRACFQPAEYLRGDFKYGVGFGFYKRDVGMAMVLLLTDDAGACAAPVDPEVFGFAYR